MASRSINWNPSRQVSNPLDFELQCLETLTPGTALPSSSLSIHIGSGFLINRLPNGWSAPLFINLNSVEFGAILGAETVHSVIHVVSDRAVDEIVQGQHPIIGSELTLTIFKTGGGGQQEQVVDLKDSDLISVSVSKGLLVDFAFTGGGIKKDNAKNHAVYGADVAAEKIVNGEVAAPEEMKELYSSINHIIFKALHQ